MIHEIGGTVGDIESCRSWRPPGRCATTSAGKTASSCTSAWCRTSVPAVSSRPSPPSTRSQRFVRSAFSPTPSCALRPGDPGVGETQDLVDVRCDVGPWWPTIDVPSIYDIPQGVALRRFRRVRGPPTGPAVPGRRLDRWNDLLDRVHDPKEEVVIALVGKYVDLPDAYLSVCEALRAGGFANRAKVVVRWVPSDACEHPRARPGRCRTWTGLHPGRLRHPWRGGQGRRDQVRPGELRSPSWGCASACSAW